MANWIPREKLKQALYAFYLALLFSFISKYFLISSVIYLTYCLSVLFNRHVFVNFPVSLLIDFKFPSTAVRKDTLYDFNIF